MESLANVYYNQCGSCLTNYSWDWDLTKKTINLQKCVATLVTNCQAIDSTTNQCKMCKDGYYLNLDNVCERMHAKGCL